MNKELVIKRFDLTIQKLKELPPTKFYYNTFVSEYEGDCGTVCCAMGWYPKWFPEAGLVWEQNLRGEVVLGYRDEGLTHLDGIGRYHGVELGLILTLFFGTDLENKHVDHLITDKFPELHNPSLQTVIERFELVVKYLKETTELDQLLTINN